MSFLERQHRAQMEKDERKRKMIIYATIAIVSFCAGLVVGYLLF